MSIRKFLLSTFMDLQVSKIVVKGTYIEAFVYHLPVEFKILVENTKEGKFVIFDDDKLIEICDELNLDYTENMTGENKIGYDYLYRCLPNQVFFTGSIILPPDKVFIETKENIIIENINNNIRKFTQNIKFNKSKLNKKIKNGCLIEVYRRLSDSICEYNSERLPIKEFDHNKLDFFLNTYEILSTASSYHFFGDVCFEGKRLRKKLISRGIEKFDHEFSYYLSHEHDRIGGKWVIISDIP